MYGDEYVQLQCVWLSLKGEVSVWLAEVMVVLGVWGGRRGQPFISQFSLSSYKGMEPCHLCVLCHDSSPVSKTHQQRLIGQRDPQSKDLLVVMSVPGLQWLFSTEVSPGSVLAAGKVSGCGLGCVERLLLCREQHVSCNPMAAQRGEPVQLSDWKIETQAQSQGGAPGVWLSTG